MYGDLFLMAESLLVLGMLRDSTAGDRMAAELLPSRHLKAEVLPETGTC